MLPKYFQKTSLKNTDERNAASYGGNKVIGGKALREKLAVQSTTAFSRLVKKGQLGFELFHLPGRRGRFALECDVDAWLNEQKQKRREPKPEGE